MIQRGSYYDGRSAVMREVRLVPAPGQVWLQGEDWERRETLQDVQIGERLGSAPRVIRFADGASCEVADGPSFTEWLQVVGHADSAVDRAQRSWVLAIVALLAVMLVGAAGYRWGLPLAAQLLAQRVPRAVSDMLSAQTLNLLDDHLLHPTTLSAERCKGLTAEFSRLAGSGDAQLLFRSGGDVGPNAMALPDGRILLLDELVAVAKNDEEILAVLAHELGHVERRHSLRLMIQGTVIGAFVAWWIGDFSPLIASAPAAILQARHSRELESEADADAVHSLRSLGIAPSRLADILERISAVQGERGANEKKEEKGGWTDYLSSHPATRDRIAMLRGQSPP